MKLDFFARRAHYIDHMAPVYKSLPHERRGIFTVPDSLYDYARKELGDLGHIEIYDGETPRGNDPILVASYGDISRAARNPSRKIVHMEHGIGHAFGTAPYPNGPRGKRDLVDLFLAPNEYTARLIRSVRSTRVEVIGTPKMDHVDRGEDACRSMSRPTLAIAFHWGDRNSKPPEAGSAFEHYKDFLPKLKKQSFRIFGHGHPLAADIYQKEFERLGIDWLDDFRDVCRLADIYINDLSSTLYEFLLTDKPVIVLNAPWFRKDIHWGLRFWDYSDVGINVWQTSELLSAIEETLANYQTVCWRARSTAVHELYPYFSHSAQRAAEVLTKYLEEQECTTVKTA
jgi:hypothetical protein